MNKIERVLNHEPFMLNRLAPVALVVLPMVAGAAFVAAVMLGGWASTALWLLFAGLTWQSASLAYDTIVIYRIERFVGNAADEFSDRRDSYYQNILDRLAQHHSVMFHSCNGNVEEMKIIIASARDFNIDFNEDTRTFTPAKFELQPEDVVEEKIRAIVK